MQRRQSFGRLQHQGKDAKANLGGRDRRHQFGAFLGGTAEPDAAREGVDVRLADLVGGLALGFGIRWWMGRLRVDAAKQTPPENPAPEAGTAATAEAVS